MRSSTVVGGAVAFLLSACGGGGDGGPVDPGKKPVATVTVSPGPTLNLTVGSTTQLSATLRDDQGNTLSGRTVTWSSTAAGVASVSSTGLVTAATPGTAEVGATSEGKTGTVSVTVAPVPVASITLSATEATLVATQTLQLAATPRDAAGQPLAGRSVTWTSSAPDVASVTPDAGLVTAVAAGSATITATSEGRHATAAITVAEGGLLVPAGNAVSSGDGAVSVTAPAGAVTEPTAVTIVPVANPPAHPRLVTGTAFALGPDGTAFTQPVTVRLRYPASLPPGVDPAFFAVHRWNGTAWVELADRVVDVPNRAVTGRTSGFSTFAIIELPSNPAPVVSSLSPNSVMARGLGFTLTVHGTGFVAASEVRWNGAARPTTLVSGTQLTAAISDADIAVAGAAQVTVFTPTPGGGTSAPQAVTIEPTVPCTMTCYVAATGHDADHDGTSPNDAFLTIQKGLDAVAAGGSVIVGAGTFAAATITKSVRVRGFRADTDARFRTGMETTITVPGGGAGLTVSGSAVTVIVDGLRFAAGTSGSGSGIGTTSGLTGTLFVFNSIFTYTVNATSVSLLRGIDATAGDATLTASRNLFDRVGVLFGTAGRAISVGTTGAGAAASISDNLIQGTGLRMGIVLAGTTGGTQITGNVIAATSSGSTGISIAAGTTGNGTTVTHNSIFGHNAGGLTNASTLAVDATCNWWGAATGPGPTPSNPVNGAGAANVAASPWLVSNSLAPSAPCTTEVPPPCTQTCYVAVTGHDGNSGVDVANAMRNLQAAITRVNDGGTIIVAPGLYNPLNNTPPANINTVNKSITFLGAQAGVSVAGRDPASSATESIIQANQGLNVNTGATVTVDGFTFIENAVNNSSGITVGTGGTGIGATIIIRHTIFLGLNTAVSSSLGDNASASTLSITNNRFDGGRTAIQVVGGNDATAPLHASLAITDNVFTGQSSHAIHAAIWQDAQINDNTFTDVSAPGASPPLTVGGCVDCQVRGNTFTNPGGPNVIAVIGTNGPSVNTTVIENTVVNPSAANNLALFVGLANGTLITGNTVTNAKTAAVGINRVANNTTVSGNTLSNGTVGVHAGQGGFGSGAGIIVEDNTISGAASGVAVDQTATVRRNVITAASVAGVTVAETGTDGTLINRNALAGNATGVKSLTTTPVNATCNWWGSASGPSGEGPGTGVPVSLNVLFTPFLTSALLTAACPP